MGIQITQWGIPGDGDTSGPGGGPVGNGGKANDALVHMEAILGLVIRRFRVLLMFRGYRASLDANKVMPAQAVRRGITGTVTIRVYFDGEGNYIRAEIEGVAALAFLIMMPLPFCS